jgi:DNA-binding response OmpR family regulator
MIFVDERRRFRARIALIENDIAARNAYLQTLTAAGFNVCGAGTRTDGLATLDQAPGVEVIVCSYNLGDHDAIGGLSLADSLQSMWADPRPDRLPSVLLMGSPERLEQELRADEHGAYFVPKTSIVEIVRKIDLILLKRRQIEHQELFFIEHFGRLPGTTYCTEVELISAIYAGHRTRRISLRTALRERLAFDMLARHRHRWLSLEELADLLRKSDFHSRHDLRDWKFSPRSLKMSLHLLRNQIQECATNLRADFRANQLILTQESGHRASLYKLNCEASWMHP